MNYRSIIEDYFLGRIEGADLVKFQEDLSSNKELRAEFEIYRRALEYILSEEKNIILISNKLKDFDLNLSHMQDVLKYKTGESHNEDELKLIEILNSGSQEIKRDSMFKSLIMRFLKGAAILVFVSSLGFTAYLGILKLCTTNEEVFEKFYEPYYYSIITRSSANNAESKVDRALLYYNKGEFQKTLVELKDIPDSSKYEITLVIEGISLIEAGSFKEAITKFKIITEESIFYSTALWYTGLCYLKLDDPVSAKSSFQKIKSIEPYYKTRSKHLLKYI